MDVNSYLNKIDESFSNINDGIYATENAYYINNRIQELSFYCKRLSTPQIGYMLNIATKYLDIDECFVNLGVWEGYTFFAGGVDNHDKLVIGVDNFSEMNEEKGASANSISRKYGKTKENFYYAYDFLKNDNLQFHERDWEFFLDNFKILYPNKKIGAVFYDANHTASAHNIFFKKIKPLLSEKCVIFIDDLRYDFVREASNIFIKQNSDFKILINIEVKQPRHPSWWAGFQVIVRS